MQNPIFYLRRRRVASLLSCVALVGLGGMLPSVAHADTFVPDDNFIAGTLHTDEPVSLTVTKYKQTSSGATPTGSSQDEENIGGDATPLQGVDFALYPITLQDGCSAADLKITNNNTAGTTDAPTVNCGDVDSTPQKIGTTDGNGKIVWHWDNFSAVQYYVLQETNKPTNVTVSQDSLFGLPFYAMNTGNVAGYVYNLSVFPKNLSTNQVNKSVDGPIVAQAGNTLTYDVSERIYNSKNGDNPPNGTGGTLPGDGYLDISEISSATDQPQLRIVDRLSSALTIKDDPIVSWDCAGQNDTVIDPENYTLTTTDVDPGRIPANQSTDPIFPDKDSGAGTNFVTVDLWNSGTADDFVAAAQSCLAGLDINVKLVATVSSGGDTAAGGAGTLQNTVNVDVYDGVNGVPNPDGPATVDTSSGGFDFAKTDKTSAVGLSNATYRLANPSDPTQFLLEDGTFSNAETKPLKAFVTATSNSNGVVTFVGLPLFKASDYHADAEGNSVLDGSTEVDSPWMSTDAGSGGKLNLIEVTAPTGYAAPNTSFGTVDFSAYIGKTAKDIAATGNVIPVINNNIFGKDYTANPSVVSTAFKDANGKAISLGMMNFTAAEAPIGLPLTGGQGIVLFLVVGAGVMAMTLYVRHRRNRRDNHRMIN